MAIFETVAHAYCFDTDKPDQRAEYEALKAKMAARGRKPFVSWGGHYRTEIDGVTVTLDDADGINLFGDQWSATLPGGKGARLFDWAETARSKDFHLMHKMPANEGAPLNIRKGHYLDETDAMRARRNDVFRCGYCGHAMLKADAPTFCPKCIGSEYMKPENFQMTQMQAVAAGRDRPALTPAQMAERTDAWREARREGAKSQAGAKLSAFRASVTAKHDKVVTNSASERDGFLWLIDHDLGMMAADNVIFYSHTGRFGFGWRAPLDYQLACEVMGQLSDGGFPFPYDVETIGKGKLSGMVEASK